MSPATRPGLGVLLLSFFLPGCGHDGGPRTAADVPASSSRPATGPPAAPAAGAVSFDVLVDPNAPKPRLGEHEEFIQPELRSAPLPVFPPAALAAGAGPATIGVRLTINEGGTVSDVEDSPLVPSYSGPFAAEFREAVERAVRRWICTQARIDTVRDAPPNAGYDAPTILVKWRPVRVRVDVTFHFSVVDGKGSVDLGRPAK